MSDEVRRNLPLSMLHIEFWKTYYKRKGLRK